MGEKPRASFLPSWDPGLLAQRRLGDDFSRADSWMGKAEPEQEVRVSGAPVSAPGDGHPAKLPGAVRSSIAALV